MKRRYQLLCATLLIGLASIVSANDSAYYMSGDQLIPLQQTDIAIKKEVLNITRTEIDKFDSSSRFIVDVDYTFYNPGKAKNIIVGFEADAPSQGLGDSSKLRHPFMKNFSVELNNQKLPYQVAITEHKKALKKGNMRGISGKRANILVEKMEGRSPYKYVYYFNAPFKSGINRLKHRYQFDSASSVATKSELSYVLTAANRWENQQIEDFTLNIYWGNSFNLLLKNTFFNNLKDWTSNGTLMIEGKKMDYAKKRGTVEITNDYLAFESTGDTLTFKKKNFHPMGELYLFVPRNDSYKHNYDGDRLNYHYCLKDLSLSYDELLANCSNLNTFEQKILRNLPFAKRGYVFHDKEVQAYYEGYQNWYQPNPQYKANMKDFSEAEVNWVNYWKKH